MTWYMATCQWCGGKFGGKGKRTPKYCSRHCVGAANAHHLPRSEKKTVPPRVKTPFEVYMEMKKRVA